MTVSIASVIYSAYIYNSITEGQSQRSDLRAELLLPEASRCVLVGGVLSAIERHTLAGCSPQVIRSNEAHSTCTLYTDASFS